MAAAQLALTDAATAVQPAPPSSNAELWREASATQWQQQQEVWSGLVLCPHCGSDLQPIIEVAFHNQMWWPLPADTCTSYNLFEAATRGAQAYYSFGERNYEIDFNKMEQVNTSNGRRRSVRLLWLARGNEEADSTGQLQSQEGCYRPATGEPPKKKARR